MALNFPLNLSFKIVAVAPQILVTDDQGGSVCYVRQKLLKLKEAVEVFTDKTRQSRICEIKADRVIDFSATYDFIGEDGSVFGAVQRQGARSLWRAHYLITDGSEPVMEIREEKPMAKVMDGIFGAIPVLGGLTGYLFHPSYVVTRLDTGEALCRIRKQPAFWEGRFTIEKLAELDSTSELRVLMAALMMLLLERDRG